MPVLEWDVIGERFYETGVDHGVLYIPNGSGVYTTGVPWNGLTSVSETPSGAEATPTYADNLKYLNLVSLEEFGATIEAYTFPEEFNQFDGFASPEVGMVVGQQPRKTFGLSYRTRLGNDLLLDAFGYKLHLVYGCLAAPSEKAYNTINDSPEAITFSWELSTTPVPFVTTPGNLAPTSLIVINSTEITPANLVTLEEALYGDATTGVAHLPTPDEVVAIVGAP